MILKIPANLTRDWLLEDLDPYLPPTATSCDLLRDFTQWEWIRLAGDARQGPSDLAVTTLLARQAVGGRMEGNSRHQFILKDGQILDIHKENRDVGKLQAAYHIENGYIGSPEHLATLSQHLALMNEWIDDLNEMLAVMGEHRKRRKYGLPPMSLTRFDVAGRHASANRSQRSSERLLRSIAGKPE